MRLLPPWVATNPNPAFYDTESGSAIEQTAKVYGAMNELIKEYNEFAEKVNKIIADFTTASKKEQEQFKECITKLVHNYFNSFDTKIYKQDLKIEEAVKYMKDNITQTAIDLLNQGLSNGSIVIGLNYNPGTEDLNISGTIVDADSDPNIIYDAETETIYHEK